MTMHLVAAGSGTVVGFVYCASLWATAHRTIRKRSWSKISLLESIARVGLIGITLSLLMATDAINLVIGLLGFSVTRWYAIYRLGGVKHEP